MNPAMTALGGANPGLMPLAFLSGGHGHRESKWEDFSNADVVALLLLVFGFLAIAVLNLYFIGLF